jgi:hypothetical protein
MMYIKDWKKGVIHLVKSFAAAGVERMSVGGMLESSNEGFSVSTACGDFVTEVDEIFMEKQEYWPHCRKCE